MIANVKAWYTNALRGKSLTYHIGYLARDRETRPRDATEKAYYEEIGAVANYLFKLAEEGRVSLVQKKVAPMQFEYIATIIR